MKKNADIKGYLETLNIVTELLKLMPSKDRRVMSKSNQEAFRKVANYLTELDKELRDEWEYFSTGKGDKVLYEITSKGEMQPLLCSYKQDRP